MTMFFLYSFFVFILFFSFLFFFLSLSLSLRDCCTSEQELLPDSECFLLLIAVCVAVSALSRFPSCVVSSVHNTLQYISFYRWAQAFYRLD